MVHLLMFLPGTTVVFGKSPRFPALKAEYWQTNHILRSSRNPSTTRLASAYLIHDLFSSHS